MIIQSSNRMSRLEDQCQHFLPSFKLCAVQNLTLTRHNDNLLQTPISDHNIPQNFGNDKNTKPGSKFDCWFIAEQYNKIANQNQTPSQPYPNCDA